MTQTTILPAPPPTLIVGLHVDVSGSELKQLLEGRLEHHRARAANYHKQLDDMRKMTQGLDEEAAKISKSSMRSPLDSIEEAIRKHQNQIVYYTFMAAHVVIAATYRLAENDLLRLGIQSDRF
mgnify:CR=1 FL=1